MPDSTTRGSRRDWQRRRFCEVAEIDGGLVSPTADSYRNLRHIGPENIESGTGRIIDVRTAAALGLVSGKYRFDADSIVYSKIRPNLNKVATPTFSGLCSADAYVIRPRPNVVTKRFLACYLRSRAFLEQAIAVSARTGMPKINQADLNRLWVVVPPIPLQEHLASMDMHYADARGLTLALATAKRSFARGLLQRLITQSRHSHTLDGAWETYRLGDLFDERTEAGRTDLPLLSITAERGIVSRDEIERRDTSNMDKGQYLRIVPGDIGYNTMRMWQGVSALSSLEGIVSPAYTVLIPRPLVDGAFAAQYFKYPPVINEFRRHSQGLVDDTLNLKFHHFARIRLAFPPLAVQRAIGALLTLLDQEAVLLDQLATALDRQKNALLEKLFSGEIRGLTS